MVSVTGAALTVIQPARRTPPKQAIDETHEQVTCGQTQEYDRGVLDDQGKDTRNR